MCHDREVLKVYNITFVIWYLDPGYIARYFAGNNRFSVEDFCITGTTYEEVEQKMCGILKQKLIDGILPKRINSDNNKIQQAD